MAEMYPVEIADGGRRPPVFIANVSLVPDGPHGLPDSWGPEVVQDMSRAQGNMARAAF
ncbi:MAG: hypothetical protein AAGB18_09650 [Pseudomonadota bacterium]